MAPKLIRYRRLIQGGVYLAAFALCVVAAQPAVAQSPQNAGGNGLGDASEITGVDEVTDIQGTIVGVVVELLKFVALAATIVVIIGGVYLVVGGGSDAARGKAKNMILYTLVGIVVILLAGAIVNIFVT